MALIAEDKIITIGVVSRLERIKGMDLVIPAFAKVHAVYPNTRVLIVGDGSLRQSMEQSAKDFENSVDRNVDAPSDSKLVTFMGRQPQDKLQDCYDQIDILLMPSRSEGFGLTAVEGMARGCVLVVTDTGGLPEVVRDGVDGLLHKPEDVEDLAEKIKMVVGDRELMKKLSDNAIKRARDFSRERYNAAIAAWYNQLSNS